MKSVWSPWVTSSEEPLVAPVDRGAELRVREVHVDGLDLQRRCPGSSPRTSARRPRPAGCGAAGRSAAALPTPCAKKRCGTRLNSIAISRDPLRQPLAGADVEGHARPAPVVDGELDRRVGRGRRVRIDLRLLAVARHASCRRRLPGRTGRARPSRRRASSGNGRIDCRTFTFSSRTASASKPTGGSIAVRQRSWSRWFWNMSRRRPPARSSRRGGRRRPSPRRRSGRGRRTGGSRAARRCRWRSGARRRSGPSPSPR